MSGEGGGSGVVFVTVCTEELLGPSAHIPPVLLNLGIDKFYIKYRERVANLILSHVSPNLLLFYILRSPVLCSLSPVPEARPSRDQVTVCYHFWLTVILKTTNA